jgi:flavin-binding protein dodecin
MSEHVYRVTELVGTSQESIEDAIRTGITRANQTVRNIDWFEVTEIRGYVREGRLNHYQVGMKLGFKLEDV